MAGFGDVSNYFQRHAVIPCGGIKIETGCWTQATEPDKVTIPTLFTKVYCLILSGGKTSVSGIPSISETDPNNLPSGNVIDVTVKIDTPVGQVFNYIACGE